MSVLRSPGYLKRLPSKAGRIDAAGGPSFLGAGWEAGGAVVESVVAGPGARVEEGARLRRCVLGKDVVIGRGASVDDCVIWDGVRVAENARLAGSLCVRETGAGGPIATRPLR